MTLRSIFGAFLFAMAVAACSSPFGKTEAIAAEPAQAYFIDILYLKNGKTPADAKLYFDRTVPVVAKHGLARQTPGFVITSKMAGAIEPNLVNVWTVADPQNTFKDIFADPDYIKHMALRDATFDMQRSHMFMMKAAK